MGAVRNITAIAIQGRPHSVEYVSEFTISYGYNGLDYADFKEPGGNIKVKHQQHPHETKKKSIISDEHFGNVDAIFHFFLYFFFFFHFNSQLNNFYIANA